MNFVADKLLLALSAHSVASVCVEAEAEATFKMEATAALRILPIRLGDTMMDTDTPRAAHIRRTRHIGDFRQWQDESGYPKALARLLRDLRVTG